jgi:hypothetical protein
MAQRKKKIVFVMIDGLADVQIPAYHFQTPLEHAKTPWMDAMASKIVPRKIRTCLFVVLLRYSSILQNLVQMGCTILWNLAWLAVATQLTSPSSATHPERKTS